jgi:hypothetical protein
VVLFIRQLGTMERIVSEGQVATAATHAHIASLTQLWENQRLMVYDLHTLQKSLLLLHGNACQLHNLGC